jgi:DNA ligase (NAD+)
VIDHRHGRLVQAATRGDGSVGDDVTHNAAGGAISGLPANLLCLPGASDGVGVPDEVEVRGEVYVTLQDFERVRVCSSSNAWSVC